MLTKQIEECGLELVGLDQLAQYLLLVHKLKNVRRIEQYESRANDSHRKKHNQLQPIDHKRHILPVVPHLHAKMIKTFYALKKKQTTQFRHASS